MERALPFLSSTINRIPTMGHIGESNTAFGDQGIEPTTEPDWDSMDRSIFPIEYLEADSGNAADDEMIEALARELSLKMLERVLDWMWQKAMSDPDGFKIRSIVVGWVISKRMRTMTLTQIATGFGLEKQSLGRWVDQWKRDFPTIKNHHMK